MLYNYDHIRHAQAIETQTRYQRAAATNGLIRELRRAVRQMSGGPAHRGSPEFTVAPA